MVSQFKKQSGCLGLQSCSQRFTSCLGNVLLCFFSDWRKVTPDRWNLDGALPKPVKTTGKLDKEKEKFAKLECLVLPGDSPDCQWSCVKQRSVVGSNGCLDPRALAKANCSVCCEGQAHMCIWTMRKRFQVLVNFSNAIVEEHEPCGS